MFAPHFTLLVRWWPSSSSGRKNRSSSSSRTLISSLPTHPPAHPLARDNVSHPPPPGLPPSPPLVAFPTLSDPAPLTMGDAQCVCSGGGRTGIMFCRKHIRTHIIREMQQNHGHGASHSRKTRCKCERIPSDQRRITKMKRKTLIEAS